MLFTHGPLDLATRNAHAFTSGLLFCSAIDDTLSTARTLMTVLDDDLDSLEDIEDYKETIEALLERILQRPIETGA